MGASTSRSECPALGIIPDCGNISTIVQNGREVVTAIGKTKRGEVSPDGDIAGIGVRGPADPEKAPLPQHLLTSISSC